MTRRILNTTLALILQGDKVLLGEKKRGFAAGTFNGIGGKQDPGETIDEAMVRETQEEIGVTPTNYKKVGNIDFINLVYKGENVDIKLHIYTCGGYVGEIKETGEMIPQWFNIKDVPYDKMLPDDTSWFPLVLEGKKIKGTISYGETPADTVRKISIIKSAATLAVAEEKENVM